MLPQLCTISNYVCRWCVTIAMDTIQYSTTLYGGARSQLPDARVTEKQKLLLISSLIIVYPFTEN